MLVMTTKLSRGKLIAVLLAAAAAILLIVRLAGGSPADRPQSADVTTNEGRVAYLSDLGYTVRPEPVQTQEVTIPAEFNEVFRRYNELQQSQGFDLAAYAGKRAKRYVYRVEGEPGGLEATLIIYRDTVIAADLSSSEGEGSLRALLPVQSGDSAA